MAPEVDGDACDASFCPSTHDVGVAPRILTVAVHDAHDSRRLLVRE